MGSLSSSVFFSYLMTYWNNVSDGLGSNFVIIFQALWLDGSEYRRTPSLNIEEHSNNCIASSNACFMNSITKVVDK